MPSFILIRRTVWPQCTNVTDRSDRQTDRQRSDSIGRTVRANRFTNGRPITRLFRIINLISLGWRGYPLLYRLGYVLNFCVFDIQTNVAVFVVKANVLCTTKSKLQTSLRTITIMMFCLNSNNMIYGTVSS